MPIPDDHLQRLEVDLSGRERWLRTLRLQITALQDEASAHEMILALGRDPNVLRGLHELYDRPELGERIAQDPRSFFEERGIRLADDVTVTSDSQRSAIEARFLTSTLEYGVGWSRRDGFYLVILPGYVNVASNEPGAPNAE